MQDLKSEWLAINKKIQMWREASYSFAKPTEPTKYSLCAFILQPHPQEKAMFVFIVWKGKTSLMRNPAAGLVCLFIFKQKLITAVHHQVSWKIQVAVQHSQHARWVGFYSAASFATSCSAQFVLLNPSTCFSDCVRGFKPSFCTHNF